MAWSNPLWRVDPGGVDGSVYPLDGVIEKFEVHRMRRRLYIGRLLPNSVIRHRIVHPVVSFYRTLVLIAPLASPGPPAESSEMGRTPRERMS